MSRLLAAVALTVVLAAGCTVTVGPGGDVAVVARPRLAYIPGTAIQVVNGMNNTFYYGGSYWRYYNGMWWRSSYFNRGWVINPVVPSVFLRIPAHHPSYHIVRYHPSYRRPVIKRTTTPVYKKTTPVYKAPAKKTGPGTTKKLPGLGGLKKVK